MAQRPGVPQPRDKLAALLWGDGTDAHARHSLRQSLVALRRALPATDSPVLLDKADTLALDPAFIEVDTREFERLAASASPEAWEAAMTMYGGALLEGLVVDANGFEEWLTSERDRLQEIALEMMGRLLSHQSRAGHVEAAIHTGQRLLGLDPLLEPVHRALMGLYARQGRRAAALRQYQICLAALERELRAAPEPETRQLYQEILQSRSVTGPVIAESLPGAERRRSAELPADLLQTDVPIVGRDEELTLVREAEDTARQRHAQVLMILGQAGIGKTRLVAEATAGALARGAHVLVGRARESQGVFPFSVWVDGFRSGTIIDDLLARGTALPVSLQELGRLFPELGLPEPAPAQGPEDFTRLFEALAQAIATLAGDHQLVLLVLEDLHWADEMSLRFLSFLVRRLADSPLLVLATARDEELPSAPLLELAMSELQHENWLRRLDLGPLSKPETATLVRALAPSRDGDPGLERLVDEVWIATDGDPFMVVETLRALREDSIDIQVGGKISLPQRAQELIASRLARLSERARAVVEAAAVFGRSFAFILVQGAVGLASGEVAGAVEELVGRRVLHVAGEQLDFTHDRIRDVAYARLLPPQRKELHRRVAESIEAAYPGDIERHVEALAAHYRACEEWGKAVDCLLRSARRASRAFADADAARDLREAFDLIERLPSSSRQEPRLEVVSRLARCLFSLSKFSEARDLLEVERAHLGEAADPATSSRYYLLLADAYAYVGDRERTMPAAERALQEARRCGDETAVGKALCMLAVESYFSGQHQRGIEHALSAVSLLERAEDHTWLARAYWIATNNCIVLAQFDQALDVCERLLAIATATGEPRVLAMAGFSRGAIATMTGAWDEGVEVCEQALAHARHPFTREMAARWLAYAYVERGDPARAVAVLEHFVGLDTETSPVSRIFIAEAYALAGRLDPARENARSGRTRVRAAGYRFAMGLAERVLGQIAWAGGDASEAAGCLNEALATFGSIGARYFEARTRLDLARATHALGRTAEGRTLLDEARTAFIAMNVPRWAERAERLGVELRPEREPRLSGPGGGPVSGETAPGT